MGNAAQIRQRVLALFLPVAAVLYIGGEAVSPKGTDQVLSNTATAFKVLPIAAQHPAQLYLAARIWRGAPVPDDRSRTLEPVTVPAA